MELYESLKRELGGDFVPIRRVANYLHKDYRSLTNKPFVRKEGGRWMVTTYELADWLKNKK